MLVEKRLHWVWLGEGHPSQDLIRCQKSVIDLHPHPEWDFNIHRDNEVLYHPALADLRDRLLAFWEKLGSCNRQASPNALRADLLRLCLLYVHGGFTFDWDMYCVQSLEKFRNEEVVWGWVSPDAVGECLMGAPQESEIIKGAIEWFLTRTIVVRHVGPHLSGYCQDKGIHAYPTEYFCPHLRFCTGDEHYWHTPNTHTIHLFTRNFTYDFDRLEQIGRNLRRNYGEDKLSVCH